MKKSKIVWYALCGLFLLGSLSFIPNGEWQYFIGGLVIAAAFGFIGYRKGAKPAPVPEVAPAADASPYARRAYKLTGVTFKNDDGSSRQSVLRKLKFNDPPFDEGVELELSRYEWEGKPALAVLANGLQIGNIPANDVGFLIENWERIIGFTNCHVYGGGRGEDGEQKSFGVEVVLQLNMG